MSVEDKKEKNFQSEQEKQAQLSDRYQSLPCFHNWISNIQIYEIQAGKDVHVGNINLCVRRFQSFASKNENNPVKLYRYSTSECPICRYETGNWEHQTGFKRPFPAKISLFKNTGLTKDDVKDWINHKLEINSWEIRRPVFHINKPIKQESQNIGQDNDNLDEVPF